MSDPIWEPCLKRQVIEVFRRDGSRGEKMRCAHLVCESYAKNVTAEICASCPLRVPIPVIPPNYKEQQVTARDFQQPKAMPDGSLVYEKTGLGLDPPICPGGYKRKSEDFSTNDAWVFVPLWPECRDRQQVNTVSPCGCISVHPFCTSAAIGNDKNNRLVVLNDCEGCPAARK